MAFEGRASDKSRRQVNAAQSFLGLSELPGIYLKDDTDWEIGWIEGIHSGFLSFGDLTRPMNPEELRRLYTPFRDRVSLNQIASSTARSRINIQLLKFSIDDIEEALKRHIFLCYLRYMWSVANNFKHGDSLEEGLSANRRQLYEVVWPYEFMENVFRTKDDVENEFYDICNNCVVFFSKRHLPLFMNEPEVRSLNLSCDILETLLGNEVSSPNLTLVSFINQLRWKVIKMDFKSLELKQPEKFSQLFPLVVMSFKNVYKIETEESKKVKRKPGFYLSFRDAPSAGLEVSEERESSTFINRLMKVNITLNKDEVNEDDIDKAYSELIGVKDSKMPMSSTLGRGGGIHNILRSERFKIILDSVITKFFRETKPTLSVQNQVHNIKQSIVSLLTFSDPRIESKKFREVIDVLITGINSAIAEDISDTFGIVRENLLKMKIYLRTYLSGLSVMSALDISEVHQFVLRLKGMVGEVFVCCSKNLPWQSDVMKKSFKKIMEEAGVPLHNFKYVPHQVYSIPDAYSITETEGGKEITIEEMSWTSSVQWKTEVETLKWKEIKEICDNIPGFRFRWFMTFISSKRNSWRAMMDPIPAIFDNLRDQIGLFFRTMDRFAPADVMHLDLSISLRFTRGGGFFWK